MKNANSTASLVLDSFALLAYLLDEPGAADVEAVLEMGRAGQRKLWVCVVNWGEVLYHTERRRGQTAVRECASLMDELPVMIVDADRQLTFAAAHIKANHSLCFADAFVVALAQAKNAAVLTGDPEFKRVESLVRVEWLARPGRQRAARR